jgi:hypothetical protein
VQDFIEFLESFSPDIIHCHSPDNALVAIGCGSNTGGRSGRNGDDPGVTGVS